MGTQYFCVSCTMGPRRRGAANTAEQSSAGSMSAQLSAQPPRELRSPSPCPLRSLRPEDPLTSLLIPRRKTWREIAQKLAKLVTTSAMLFREAEA